jgi:hypothetical protein
MNKRADVVPVYFRIFEVLLLVMAISIVTAEVNNIKDSGVFQKKFLARDIALLLDSITNARGNIMYVYQPPLITGFSRFSFDFSNGRVNVDGEAWPYASNTAFPAAHQKLKGTQGLFIQKVGSEVSITQLAPQPVPFNGLVMECPGIQLNARELVIDPGYGYSKGEKPLVGLLKDSQGKPIPASEQMIRIGAAITANLAQYSRPIASTRALKFLPGEIREETKTVQERVKTIAAHKGAIVLSLRTRTMAPHMNLVKALVNKDAGPETYQLACTLLNAFATAYPAKITGTAIIPVDPSQFSPDDPRQVLLKESLAVQLELGNIDAPNNELLQNPDQLGRVIAQALPR